MSVDDQAHKAGEAPDIRDTHEAIAAETDPLRARAIKRLKKRHDFYGHLLVYILFNSFLTTIWAVTNSDGFFWPIFPMVGWGIGVIMNAWDVWRGDEPDEDRTAREMRRLQSRRS